MEILPDVTVTDEEYCWALYAQEGIRSPSKLRARMLEAGRDVYPFGCTFVDVEELTR